MELIKYAIEWSIFGVVSGICAVALNYLKSIRNSIDKLNENMAVVLSRSEDQARRIDRLEDHGLWRLQEKKNER